MPNEEVGKYLRMALALERKNYRDYKKSAEETELQSIRKMFEFLAAEEEKHVALIKEKMEQFGVPIEDE
jgi:rubrerythrin